MEKRIVANIRTEDLTGARSFYAEALEMNELMKMGWIATYGAEENPGVQISFAEQGGSDTPVPDLSIKVEDAAEACRRMKAGGFRIVYDLTDEPWGVRRSFVTDPDGNLVNILSHL
jgi:catechol 2,3-dioxygenase-like lactoylglutathione lyase family enzyme